MKIMILDTEATNKDKVNSFSANPWYPDNHAVSIYYNIIDENFNDLNKLSWHIDPMWNSIKMEYDLDISKCTFNTFLHFFNTVDLIVGHNLDFDIISITNTAKKLFDATIDWKSKKIWDTSVAAYLESGHLETFPSLDRVCELYGLPIKPNALKEYWSAGLDTIDIMYKYPEEFHEYAEHDVNVTTEIFKRQFDGLHHVANPKLYKYQKLARKATILISMKGMLLDVGSLNKSFCEAKIKAEYAEDELMRYFHFKHGIPKEVININSPQQISSLIFGGPFSYEIKEHIGTYKTGKNKGQDKYRKKEIVETLKSLVIHPTNEKMLSGTYYVVNEEILKQCHGHAVDTLLGYRKANKEVKIIENLEANSYKSGDDKIIHTKYQHTSTATGRLSSTDPNLQNVKVD